MANGIGFQSPSAALGDIFKILTGRVTPADPMAGPRQRAEIDAMRQQLRAEAAAGGAPSQSMADVQGFRERPPTDQDLQALASGLDRTGGGSEVSAVELAELVATIGLDPSAVAPGGQASPPDPEGVEFRDALLASLPPAVPPGGQALLPPAAVAPGGQALLPAAVAEEEGYDLGDTGFDEIVEAVMGAAGAAGPAGAARAEARPAGREGGPRIVDPGFETGSPGSVQDKLDYLRRQRGRELRYHEVPSDLKPHLIYIDDSDPSKPYTGLAWERGHWEVKTPGPGRPSGRVGGGLTDQEEPSGEAAPLANLLVGQGANAAPFRERRPPVAGRVAGGPTEEGTAAGDYRPGGGEKTLDELLADDKEKQLAQIERERHGLGPQPRYGDPDYVDPTWKSKREIYEEGKAAERALGYSPPGSGMTPEEYEEMDPKTQMLIGELARSGKASDQRRLKGILDDYKAREERRIAREEMTPEESRRDAKESYDRAMKAKGGFDLAGTPKGRRKSRLDKLTPEEIEEFRDQSQTARRQKKRDIERFGRKGAAEKDVERQEAKDTRTQRRIDGIDPRRTKKLTEITGLSALATGPDGATKRKAERRIAILQTQIDELDTLEDNLENQLGRGAPNNLAEFLEGKQAAGDPPEPKVIGKPWAPKGTPAGTPLGEIADHWDDLLAEGSISQKKHKEGMDALISRFETTGDVAPTHVYLNYKEEGITPQLREARYRRFINTYYPDDADKKISSKRRPWAAWDPRSNQPTGRDIKDWRLIDETGEELAPVPIPPGEIRPWMGHLNNPDWLQSIIDRMR